MARSFKTPITVEGNVTANGVVQVTQASGVEGGQIELAVAPSGTLSGTNVTLDIYGNKLRFFESGGTNRGAYIDLSSTAASVGTNILAGTTGAMNYAQTLGTKQSAVSSAGTTLVSVSFTTNGYPVQVIATGDMENNSAGGWVTLQLYRGSTAIGNIVHAEGSAGSENVPFALQVVDAPAAGTYTYALKINAAAGGTFNFGESNGPVITAVELSGPKGDTGAAGTSPNAFTTISTTSGTSPVADSTSDTLTLSAGAGSGITVTGDSTTDTVTIGTNAASANGASTLVIRDASGNFAGGTITATTFSGSGASLTSLNASNVTTGTLSGDLGVTAGSASASFVEYNGTTATAGQFDGGTVAPSGVTRLNYGGYLYATRFYGDGSNLSALNGSNVTTGTIADGRIATALTGKTYNGVTLTAPATGATITITNLKTFAVQNTLTLAGTDSTTMTFPATSATIARTDAAQTFTGSQTVRAAATQDSVIIAGRAGGTTSLGVTITPTTLTANRTATFPDVTGNVAVIAGTLAVASGKTFTASNTLTLAGTDSTTMTFPSTSATIARTDAAQTFTGAQTLTPAAAVAATAASTAGYIGMPQNLQTGPYTLVAGDAGKHIYYTASGQTVTIPANSSVAYEVGTTITFVTGSGVSLSIAITTDTLRLANSATTGTRTLAANSIATAIKIASTTWIISGNGLS